MEEWPPTPAVGVVGAVVEDVSTQTEHFRLRLVWSTLEGSVTAQLYFDAASDARSTVEGWLDAYLELLTDGLSRPDAPIAGLSLAGPTQCRTLGKRSWGPALDVVDGLVHRQFEAQVALSPSTPAVVFGDMEVTFGDLNRRANRLARRLCRAGARHDTFVALFLGRSVDQIVALLATLKAGAAYLPLDVAQLPHRLAAVLQEARPVVLLANLTTIADLPRHDVPVILLDGGQELPQGDLEGNLEVDVAPDNLAYAIATSGSTGTPKCVMVPHGALANLFAALKREVYMSCPPCHRVSLNAPLSFDASVKQLVQLGHGRTICLVSEEGRRIGAELLAGLDRDRVDLLDCTPSHLRMVLDAGLLSTEGQPGAVLIGGEAIDPQTWDRLSLDASRRYFNVYGPTETTVVASVAEVRAGSRPSLGRALANVALYVLDDDLRPVPEERASSGRSASAARASPGAMSASLVPPPSASSPTRSRGPRAPASTGPATGVGAVSTAASSSSAGATARSRSAAFASSWGRSKRPSQNTRGSPAP